MDELQLIALYSSLLGCAEAQARSVLMLLHGLWDDDSSDFGLPIQDGPVGKRVAARGWPGVTGRWK
ncbi:MAG: hypothetical protein HZA90_07890 [Verrucomicrobia bacterium]|nr:hypothetical protein [Verrucomicrobiota bacterium]